MYRATPLVSDFPVGSALLLTNNRIVAGGNMEVRRTGQSIHGEGSALTHALQRYRGVRVEAALSVGRDEKPLEACGDCREALLEYGTDTFRYLMSTPDESPARFLDRDTFLPPVTGTTKVQGTDDPDSLLIAAALRTLSRARDGCTGWPTASAVRLLDGQILQPVAASRDDGAYYHEHSVETALAIGVSVGRTNFDTIAVVARSFDPNQCGPIPCGRCLQKLTETAGENKHDIRLVMSDVRENLVRRSLSQMLPGAFVLT